MDFFEFMKHKRIGEDFKITHDLSSTDYPTISIDDIVTIADYTECSYNNSGEGTECSFCLGLIRFFGYKSIHCMAHIHGLPLRPMLKITISPELFKI